MNINANQAISILESISTINYKIEDIQSDISTLNRVNDSYIIEHLESLINEFIEARNALIQEINSCLNINFQLNIHNPEILIEDLSVIARNQVSVNDYEYTENLESIYSEPDFLDNINEDTENLISNFYQTHFK